MKCSFQVPVDDRVHQLSAKMSCQHKSWSYIFIFLCQYTYARKHNIMYPWITWTEQGECLINCTPQVKSRLREPNCRSLIQTALLVKCIYNIEVLTHRTIMVVVDMKYKQDGQVPLKFIQCLLHSFLLLRTREAGLVHFPSWTYHPNFTDWGPFY